MTKIVKDHQSSLKVTKDFKGMCNRLLHLWMGVLGNKVTGLAGSAGMPGAFHCHLFTHHHKNAILFSCK